MDDATYLGNKRKSKYSACKRKGIKVLTGSIRGWEDEKKMELGRWEKYL